VAKTKNRKKVKILEKPKPTKIAKWASEPTVHDRPLAWRFSGADRAGPFSWAAIENAEKFKEIIEKLHDFETKNWGQISDTGSHPIQRGHLVRSAQDRLVAIGQDDIDELMSFRLTGPNRVWCIQHENIMRVLWWDP
jgi:hypothetical protein